MSTLLIIGNILMALSFAFTFNRLPPQIPLFYSRPWGEAQLADWWLIFLLPIFMNGLYFLNRFLQRKIFPQNAFIAKTINYVHLFVTLTCTAVFIKILFLIS